MIILVKKEEGKKKPAHQIITETIRRLMIKFSFIGNNKRHRDKYRRAKGRILAQMFVLCYVLREMEIPEEDLPDALKAIEDIVLDSRYKNKIRLLWKSYGFDEEPLISLLPYFDRQIKCSGKK